jgi:4-cresol dehydrogenase (hydroxylating) flavoprotein subunit
MVTMRYASLPENFTSEKFDRVISEFVKVLGHEHIHTDEKKLRRFSGFLISANVEDHMPSAAIFPERAEQVIEIVKICDTFKMPLWVSSTGKNIGYGAMAPCKKGTIILSLRRMNRIIEINEELCYALIEPGVTYKQLYDHIQENDYRLWLNIPTGPTPIAGPVGTSLDRGTGYTPYGDNFEHVCGMEIVLPEGEVVRTGMGGIPDSNCWQLYKWGYGPYLDGLFSQGNFGICVKMGVWLMPEPADFRPFAITFSNREDLEQLVDTLRPLRLANVIPNSCSIAPSYGEDYAGFWNIYAALYGHSQQIAVNWEIVTEAFSKFEGIGFFTEEQLGEHPSFQIRSNLMKGVVPAKPYSKFTHANWFVPIVPSQGKHVVKQKMLADEIIKSYGFSYNAELIVGTRSMHHVMEIPFNKKSTESVKKSGECYLALIKEFARNGYGLYRTNIAFMDAVGATYGPAIRNVFSKIKRALDPNGIISPGKAGIVYSEGDRENLDGGEI